VPRLDHAAQLADPPDILDLYTFAPSRRIQQALGN
jgi:hypothetical protein